MRVGASFVLVVETALSACAPSHDPSTCGISGSSPLETTQLVRGSNQFALRLVPPLGAAAQGNAFFSPYSIESTLAMVAAGARGETATQLSTALGLSGDASATASTFASLDCGIRTDGNSGGNQLNLANAIYGQRGFSFEPAFLGILKTDYGAPLQTEDFERNPIGAVDDINGWVDGQTAGKIPKLVSPGSVNADTRLVLVNAIYFKGSWRTQFDPAATQGRPFLANGSTEASVPTMSAVIADAGYAIGEGFAVAELPYTGDHLAMDIVLPTEEGGLAALEGQLGDGAVLASLDLLQAKSLQITLPKFHVSQAVGLVPTLQDLGIQDAFGSGADFSGIDGARDLAISAVLHQAVINVDETGSTAAAATAVVVGVTSVEVSPSIIPFDVNRPFLFLIRDLPSGAILFAGHIEDPSALP